MRRPATQCLRADVGDLVRHAATLLMLMALAASVPTSAAAQRTLGSLSTGERIRISTTSSGSSSHTGRIVTASEDTVVVHSTEDGRQVTRSIPRDQITRIDVSMGQRRGRKGQFAGIGFLVGAGIAQLLPRQESQGATSILDEDDIAELGDALLLGGLGAGIGAYLGRAHEDWRRVSLGTTQVSLRAPRSGRGVAVGATIAF